MPYHPKTFKNIYPFPNQEAIFLHLQKEALEGRLTIPPSHLTDSKKWLLDKAFDLFKAEKQLWDESQKEADQAWQKHQEKEHNFESLPEFLKQKIHSQVWEDGYSGRYGEMANRYIDLVPLVTEAYELGRKQGYAFAKQGCGKIVDRF